MTGAELGSVVASAGLVPLLCAGDLRLRATGYVAWTVGVVVLASGRSPHGMTPVVELHWTYGQYTGNSAGCSDVHASCQKPMPDMQYTPSFWTSVANTFKNNTETVVNGTLTQLPDGSYLMTTIGGDRGVMAKCASRYKK